METIIRNGQLSSFQHDKFYKDSIDDLLTDVTELRFMGSQWKSSELNLSAWVGSENSDKQLSAKCLMFYHTCAKTTYYLFPQWDTTPVFLIISEGPRHSSSCLEVCIQGISELLLEPELFQLYWGGMLALLLRSKNIDQLLKKHILTFANEILADSNIFDDKGVNLYNMEWINCDGFSINSLVTNTESDDYDWN